jgi:geranylgeranyl diphosphate synthase type II
MAVLAGDALQAEAFRLISLAPGLSAQQRVDAVNALASSCGGDGMVAGQVLDIEGQARDEASLRDLCLRKTGGLLGAAALLGCIAAGASDEVRRQALDYGSHLGLAFQVRDDILDVTADQAELGKPVGSDKAEEKWTFVDLLGLKNCQRLVEEETRLAKEAIAGFPDGGFLLELADRLAGRRK